jgi:glutamate---cysteine ligase / carboxylate-amine ligase
MRLRLAPRPPGGDRFEQDGRTLNEQHVTAAGQVLAGDHDRLTFGVEEEFLLLDPDSGHNLPVADKARATLPEPWLERSRREFRQSMIEMVTPVCTDLVQLRGHLASGRAAAAAAATAAGSRLTAVGATPVREAEITRQEDERYEAIIGRFGPVALDPALCGCHVHVGVADRELAVQVCNHLRPWLSVIAAIAANSPYHLGADTGYASWRSVQLERWPSLGPSPYFADADAYDRAVAQLIETGVMLDEGMVLWHARPSARYPTVEVRVADVCTSVDDTMLVAALVRALVATVIDDVRAGAPAPTLPAHLLRAAHWRAAREGLEGRLVDLRAGRVRPAWELVDDLEATVRPALSRHDDLDVVTAQLTRLRAEGSGAQRQRRACQEGGGLQAVLARLSEQTIMA